MTKIDIFSGFLGAGKTTLIQKLLKEAYAGEKLVLIENEFGEIGIDGGFMQECGIQVTEMNSGCICCSLVGDFGKAMHEVIASYHPDRILIEPSGVGKLSDIIRAVQNVAKTEDVLLNGFTTVVDGKKCKMHMKNFGEFFNDQVANAGCIVLSHTQDLTEDKLAEDLSILKEVNKTATVVTTPWSELDGKALLTAMERTDTIAEELKRLQEEAEEEECDDPECECHHHHHHDDDDEEEHEHCHHHHDDDDDEEHEHCCRHHHDGEHHHHHHHADEVFVSCGCETAKKFDETALQNILTELQNAEKYGMILRAKGIVPSSTQKDWIYFDYIPGEPDIRHGTPSVTGRLCVIGSKINEKALSELFGVELD